MLSPALLTRYCALALAALAYGSRLTAADKPVPVASAAAKMTVPEGFRVTLFAGEPAIVQPIAFTFDDRGRMWVVECLSYPKWRTDGQGHDRVTILEDTDGDGTHDKRTVFLDNGSNLSGIEWGFGGVWLCSSPNLVFVPDRNGDDQPDGPPEVVLDGWNLKDTKHNVFNGLAWGPDGWLYGCNGIQAKAFVGRPGTPEKDRTYLDCGVWRYQPSRKAFEVVAWGTTNPWGLDWDDHGELFLTNCVIDHLWHFAPGGHYTRMYGQDPNPFVFELMGPASDHKHWAGGHWTDSRADRTTGAVRKDHDDAGGGHAHSGCAVYLGDNFPPEYRNSVFTCNIHGSRLNRDRLHRTKTGYVGKHEKDFLFANDPWFRGICVKQGPEGGLYTSDWCDTGECHNYDVADITNGRIYRTTFGSPPPFRGDVTKLSDEELIMAHRSLNEWLVRKARRILQERAVAGTLAADTPKRILDHARRSDSGHTALVQLRFYLTLHAIGKAGEPAWNHMLASEADILRVWGVRLACEGHHPPRAILGKLRQLAAHDPSAHVRAAIAGALPRVPDTDRLPLAAALLSREPEADPNLARLDWYGVQPVVQSHPEEALQLAGNARVGLVRENIIRAYLTRPGVDLPAALAATTRLLGQVIDDTTRKDILAGIRLATTGRRDVPPPAGWTDVYAKLQASADPGVRDESESLAVQFGDVSAIAAVKARLLDGSKPTSARLAALRNLTARQSPDLGPMLRGLLADPAVRAAAVRALAAYPETETPAAILKTYPSFTAAEKADAVQTLASRPAFAAALLNAVEAGRVPKSDVSVFAARQIQSLNDAKVTSRLAAVWGTVRPASQTRVEQSKKLKELLRADRLKSANVAAGRGLFVKHCAACHKMFGEGGDVGPELTGSQRTNLDYVLENVLDPSAVVPGEFRMTAFTLADGRVVTGVVKRETPQAVTVRTVNDELTLPVADIDARKQTPLSVMPDGLFDTLKDDELRDLIAYLASPTQVPASPGTGRE